VPKPHWHKFRVLVLVDEENQRAQDPQKALVALNASPGVERRPHR